MSRIVTANKSETISTEVYCRYCSQMDKEDDLIDRRVNWLLTSQAILFAAVGLSGNDTAGIVLSVVPWVGFCSSLAIGVTVWAASFSFTQYRNRLKELCPPRNDLEQYYPQLHREGVDHHVRASSGVDCSAYLQRRVDCNDSYERWRLLTSRCTRPSSAAGEREC